MADIPSLTFVTDDGIEVKRFYNKFVDPFGGPEHRDMYDMNLSKCDLEKINKMMAGKPATYEEYVRYINAEHK